MEHDECNSSPWNLEPRRRRLQRQTSCDSDHHLIGPPGRRLKRQTSCDHRPSFMPAIPWFSGSAGATQPTRRSGVRFRLVPLQWSMPGKAPQPRPAHRLVNERGTSTSTPRHHLDLGRGRAPASACRCVTPSLRSPGPAPRFAAISCALPFTFHSHTCDVTADLQRRR
jgi:hypothetical protein